MVDMAGKASNKQSFGGKIPEDLKSRIDKGLEETRIPVGLVVERLAEFYDSMTPEEQKLFCYGSNRLSLGEWIDYRLAADIEKESSVAAIHRAVVRLPEALVKRLYDHCKERDFRIDRLLEVMIGDWLGLPEAVQVDSYHRREGRKKAFTENVAEVLRELQLLPEGPGAPRRSTG